MAARFPHARACLVCLRDGHCVSLLRMIAGAPSCWWGCDVCRGGGSGDARLRAGDSCNDGLTPMTHVVACCLSYLVVHSAVS